MTALGQVAMRAVRPLFAVAILAQIAALAIYLLPEQGSRGARLSETLIVVTMFAAAAGTLLSGVADRRGKPRLPWLVLGAGLLSYAVGQTYFFFAQETAVAFPTAADAFWLAAYPGIFMALALLVREQHKDGRLGISFDAAIVATAVAALTHEFVMDRLVVIDHSANPLGEQLFAYSVLDLGLATMLALVALQSRGRIGGAYVAFSLGAIAFLTVEFFHARALVDGSYAPGTILDMGWSVAVLLFALSSRFDTSLPRATALRGRPLYLMSIASFAIAFGLLVYAALTGWHQDPGVIVFAAALPFLILIRLVLSVRENYRDPVTGVLNRRRFEEKASSRLRYARHSPCSGTLMLVDLDCFKLVNDTFGHGVGDRVLCDVATTLLSKVRRGDVVARIGGDEFAVILRHASEASALELASDMIAAIRASTEPTVGASIGIATCDNAGECHLADDLLVAADVGLYQAKEAGGGVAVANAGENGHALTWVGKIRAALAEDRFVVYSQPIVDVATGDLVREELLVRMLEQSGEVIGPGAFMQAAERFGLIHEIDLVVLGMAIELAKQARAVSVNVSGLSLADRRYLQRLELGLRQGIKPTLLDFEITETAAVANVEDAQSFAQRIRELGCTLSLDDFGTGFSSLSYLKHIPTQCIKIDAEFIHDLKHDQADQQLVQAIVSLAHGLGQKTVAEGIEDGETLALIGELGVDYAQGFHVGRPVATPAALSRDLTSSSPADVASSPNTPLIEPL